MKKLLLLILSCVGVLHHSYSQTTIAYDYMETWNWAGLWWGNTLNSTWATNASVTPSESAVIYGGGGGTSAFEQDWYVLPNITGLDPTKLYEFRFRLASYRFTSTSNTRGVDVADFVEVQVSYDGGISYISELRITGNSNAYWDYNNSGIIVHQANAAFSNNAAPAGDVYQSGPGNQTGAGPSMILLMLPIGITQVAVDIFCRVNAAGEEWWIDNIELIENDNFELPVELTTFAAHVGNHIVWETATERASAYFLLEYSATGEFNENSVIAKIPAAGTTNTPTKYEWTHTDFAACIGYYRLIQVDDNGEYHAYGPIAIDNRTNKELVRTVNSAGQQVPSTTSGIVFDVWSDGTVTKRYQN